MKNKIPNFSVPHPWLRREKIEIQEFWFPNPVGTGYLQIMVQAGFQPRILHLQHHDSCPALEEIAAIPPPPNLSTTKS